MLAECRPPLQIYLQQKFVFSCQNWLTTPPSLAPQSTHRSHLQLRQRLTWLRVWRWGGRGIHEVGRWGSVTEEIPCLIFTGLPNWTLLKDELCSWPTSCERDWRPPSLTHNHQRGSAGVGSLIKPGGGPLLIVAGPDFSCDNILSRRILKGHVFLRKSGWLLLKSY